MRSRLRSIISSPRAMADFILTVYSAGAKLRETGVQSLFADLRGYDAMSVITSSKPVKVVGCLRI